MRLRGLLLTGIAVMVVAVTGTLLVLHEDASVHADILIDRPPANVWKVVSTSAAYPDWNPFITRVDGDFRTGETIRIVLGVGPDSMVFKPTVLVVHPDHDLCWRGSVWIRGIFDGTHCIHLTAVTGGTRLEQTESFSGLLVGRLTKDVVEETERNFEAMDTALKQRVEKIRLERLLVACVEGTRWVDWSRSSSGSVVPGADLRGRFANRAQLTVSEKARQE